MDLVGLLMDLVDLWMHLEELRMKLHLRLASLNSAHLKWYKNTI